MLSQAWRPYVINLDRSPDRLAAIAARLDRLRLPFERFAAVEGRLIDPDSTPFFSRRRYEQRHGKAPTPCEIGCFLSHIGVMRRFLESDAQFCLILEDDAVLGADLPAALDGLERARREWDVALLYGNHPALAQPLGRLDG